MTLSIYPCACGSSVVADAESPMAGVQGHVRSTPHAEWSRHTTWSPSDGPHGPLETRDVSAPPRVRPARRKGYPKQAVR